MATVELLSQMTRQVSIKPRKREMRTAPASLAMHRARTVYGAFASLLQAEPAEQCFPRREP